MERQDDLEDKVREASEGMEAELADMEHQSDDVGQDIDDARADWKAKRDDSSLPGAEPRDEEDAADDADDTGQ